MRKIKILYTSSFGNIMQGGQFSLFYLLEKINREQFDFKVICSEQGNYTEKLNKNNIETIILQFPSLKTLKIWKIIKMIMDLRRIIKKGKIDILHTDAPRQTFYAGLSRLFLNTKLVWHVRVSNSIGIFDLLLYTLCSCVICVSEMTRWRFTRFHCNKKLKVIYNAVDTNVFNPNKKFEPILRNRFYNNDILIGVIGVIDEHKGQKELILASENILKEIKNVKILLIGNENKDYADKIKQLIVLKEIENNVIFIGFIDNMPAILKELDILVLPTYMEGFSRTIIEAMAMEKPVIATNVGGNPEAIENNISGLLVPVHDTIKLEKALRTILSDKQKALQMSKKARERVVANFSIERNVAETEKIYKELIKIINCLNI